MPEIVAAVMSGNGGGMTIEPEDKAALIALVRQAARDHVLPRFRNLAPGDISEKSGPADLVTLADTEAEAAITAGVKALWPDALVVGEEAVSADKSILDGLPEADRAVVLDPVDGTWNYARGLALFGMILAVTIRGETVFGMIYDPVLDDWVEAGAPEGTRMVTGEGVSRTLRADGPKGGGTSGYIPLGLMPKAHRAEIAARFPRFGRINSLRCSAHEYRMVAQGHTDFLISGRTPHPWDHAAGVLAVQGAGGVARFLDGRPYKPEASKGMVLAARTERLWDEVAEIFAFLND
jgi:fructose-1,6-bisphosphatase/inositol monophosphatase family enzyme